jgi:hypothetical protein
VELPQEVKEFIQESTGNYGKVKLVLHRNKFWVESPYPEVLRTLLQVRRPLQHHHQRYSSVSASIQQRCAPKVA